MVFYLPSLSEFLKTSNNESITAVQGGYVGNLNFEEIVVTTQTGKFNNDIQTFYQISNLKIKKLKLLDLFVCTGWVFGLSTEMPEKQVRNDATDLNYGFSREEELKIEKLK